MDRLKFVSIVLISAVQLFCCLTILTKNKCHALVGGEQAAPFNKDSIDLESFNKKINQFGEAKYVAGKQVGEPIEIRVGFLVGRQRKSRATSNNYYKIDEERARTYSTRPGHILSHVFNFAIDKINSQQYSMTQASADQLDDRTGSPLELLQPSPSSSSSSLNAVNIAGKARHKDGLLQSVNNFENKTKMLGSDDFEMSLSESKKTISGSQSINNTDNNNNNSGNKDNIDKMIIFKPIVAETYGDESESIKQTIDLISHKRVHIIIGPQDTCQVEPIIASIYNVPMVSHYCSHYYHYNQNQHHHLQQQQRTSTLSTAAAAAAVVTLRNRAQHRASPGRDEVAKSSQLLAPPQPVGGTFIQTKPPIWKIVKRVIALIRRLLNESGDSYPQQLVLLYHKDLPAPTRLASIPPPPTAATVATLRPQQKPAQLSSPSYTIAAAADEGTTSRPLTSARQQTRDALESIQLLRNGSAGLGQRSAVDRIRTRRYDERHTSQASVNLSTIATDAQDGVEAAAAAATTFMLPSQIPLLSLHSSPSFGGATNAAAAATAIATEASQYKIIGKLLEIKLKQLVDEEQPRKRSSVIDNGDDTIKGAGVDVHKRGPTMSDRQRSDGGQINGARRRRRRSSRRKSLTVLNWHTTFYYGMKNPFRNLLRRHIFQQKHHQQLKQRWQSSSAATAAAVALNQSATTLPWSSSADRERQLQCDLLRNGNGNGNGDANSYDSDKSGTTAARETVVDEGTQSTAAIYIVVGHYYDHLNLMLALDELGLLDNEQSVGGGASSVSVASDTVYQQQQGQRATEQQQERPLGGAGGAQQESGNDNDDSRQQAGGDGRHRRGRRPRRHPSIVVGVDLEPHDEGDEIARLFRDLLTDNGDQLIGRGAANVAASASANALNENAAAGGGANNGQQQQQPERLYDLNLLASKYNNYIGVVPMKPSKSVGLLDEMRHFYNKTNQASDGQRDQDHEWTGSSGGGGGGEQSKPSANNNHNNYNQRTYNSHTTRLGAARGLNSNTTFSNIYDSSLLALKMLQFARFPNEAYYLYDSVILIGTYFSECLAQSGANLADCSRGDRVFNWFSNRRYSSYIDHYSTDFKAEPNDEQQHQQQQHGNRFDSLARAEGSYILLGRRLPYSGETSPPLSSQLSGLKTVDSVSMSEQANLHLLDSSWPDDELNIVPIGRFKQISRDNGQQQQQTRPADDHIIEFNVDSSSIADVWRPLWCSNGGKRRGTSSHLSDSHADEGTLGNFDNSTSECSNWLKQIGDEEEDEDEALVSQEDVIVNKDGALWRHEMDIVIIVASLLVCFIILMTIIVLNAYQRAQCLNLDCLSGGGCEKSFEQNNISWFSADDAKNFLHIVHNLLLMPDSLINEAQGEEQQQQQQEDIYGDDDNDEGRQELAGEMEGEMVAGRGREDLGQPKSSFELAGLSYRQRRRLPDIITTKGVGIGAHIGQPDRRQRQKQNSTVPYGQYGDETEGVIERQQQREQGLQTVAIDLHCYMFPFPSCKFVHWLTALHKLKEMLFKYQSNLSGGYLPDKPSTMCSTERFGGPDSIRRQTGPNGGEFRPALSGDDDDDAVNDQKRRSADLFCCCTGNNRLMFQLPILFESTEASHHHQMSANKSDVARISVTDRSSSFSSKTNTIGSGKMGSQTSSLWWWLRRWLWTCSCCCCWWCSNNERGSPSCFSSSPSPSSFHSRRINLSPLNPASRSSGNFFTGRHKYSASLRLLLNKYRATNECLCNLDQLQHVNVVKLLGVTLLSGTNNLMNDCGIGKLAQLIVEQTERANLREELLKLESNFHLSPNCRDHFKPALWRTLLTDLLDGLEYLHNSSKIRFHGELNATNCLITSNWRLKLAGFHVHHMRRSFGYYVMRVNNSNTYHHSDIVTKSYNNNGHLSNQGIGCGNVAGVSSGSSSGGVDKQHYYADNSIYFAPEILLPTNSSGTNCGKMNIVANKADSATTLLSDEQMQLADLYSCAFVIYELLVSQEPWSCLHETRACLHDGGDYNVADDGKCLGCCGGISDSSGSGGVGLSASHSASDGIGIFSSKLLLERVKIDPSFRPPMSRLDKISPILVQQALPSRRRSTLYNTTDDDFNNLLPASEHHMQSCSPTATPSTLSSSTASSFSLPPRSSSSAQHLNTRTQFRGAAATTVSTLSNAAPDSTIATRSHHANYNALKHPLRARNRGRKFDLNRLKGLLESCWSYSPQNRPTSVRELRNRLADALEGTLIERLSSHSTSSPTPNCVAPAMRAPSKLSNNSSSCSSLRACKLYTKLLEQTSRERSLALSNERRLHDQISVALLPRGFDASSHLVSKQQRQHQQQQCVPPPPVNRHNCVYLCFFRFIILPRSNNNCSGSTNGNKSSTSSSDSNCRQTEAQQHALDQYNIFNGILHQLDDLVDSYRGHVHLWDSQVDSMMRFMLCATEPGQFHKHHRNHQQASRGEAAANHRLRAVPRSKDTNVTYSRLSLVTTFAFELIDLANKWQAKFDGQIQVKCALHLGPANGTCLLPNNYYTTGRDFGVTCAGRQRGKIKYHVLNLARYILSGPTVQCADILEQTGQPQRIHISAEYRAKLLEISKTSGGAVATSQGQEFDFRSLLPPILGATSTAVTDGGLADYGAQQQGYVILKRSSKIQAKNFDCETYWLLNGPRVTLSQRLMLPLISSL